MSHGPWLPILHTRHVQNHIYKNKKIAHLSCFRRKKICTCLFARVQNCLLWVVSNDSYMSPVQVRQLTHDSWCIHISSESVPVTHESWLIHASCTSKTIDSCSHEWNIRIFVKRNRVLLVQIIDLGLHSQKDPTATVTLFSSLDKSWRLSAATTSAFAGFWWRLRYFVPFGPQYFCQRWI